MLNKTVSLVLGSGGARGISHIGVIEVLEKEGYKIKSIAGSSIGALVGGIYAAGKIDVFKEWILALEKMDIIRLLDFSFSLRGLFRGDKLIETLSDLIGNINIEDLPIDYTAVATDINSQREVWFDEGPLFDAIRASIAIPSVFTPVEIFGRQLMDGGILNPIPIAPTLTDMTDLTIAVNLSANIPVDIPVDSVNERELPLGTIARPKPSVESNMDMFTEYRDKILGYIENLYRRTDDRTLEKKEEPETDNYFDLMGKTIDTMQNTLAKIKLATYTPDIIVEIPREACSFYEFHRAKEMIDIGIRQTEVALKRHRESLR